MGQNEELEHVNGIPILYEERRGCGYRTPGGVYMMGPAPTQPCCIFPVPVEPCCRCGHLVKQNRGWVWVSLRGVLGLEDADQCASGYECWLPGAAQAMGLDQRAGLLWVGASHYPTVRSFMAEAARVGVSKKLKAIPAGFEPGRTPVALAHPHAIQGDGEMKSAVFSVFMPDRVECVVTEEDAERGVERQDGAVPVIVRPADQ